MQSRSAKIEHLRATVKDARRLQREALEVLKGAQDQYRQTTENLQASEEQLGEAVYGDL